jgi:hypothetical protein
MMNILECVKLLFVIRLRDISGSMTQANEAHDHEL